jgi:hypothetical protein
MSRFVVLAGHVESPSPIANNSKSARGARLLGIAFLTAAATLIVPTRANAETIGFSCERTGVNNPRTYYFQVDLAASTVSMSQAVDIAAYTARAMITPATIDWNSGFWAYHLDRQTGLLGASQRAGYVMDYACQKTNGF